jgi:Tfp pilus assembly protein PilP
MVLLAGCQEDPVTAGTMSDYAAQRDQMKKQMQQRRTGPRQQAAPPEAVAQQGDGGDTSFGAVEQGYAYDATGKRDPFRSFQFVDEEVPKVGFGPLGDYELGQLAVVAVVWDAGRPRALVADPGGRSFVIREGSQIGKNAGRVIHIGDNLVLVKETYVDFEGHQTTRDVEMRIRRSQGG